MGRTVSAVVTHGTECLGTAGEFVVDSPWWSDVGPVCAGLRERLGVPVFVLRLLRADGDGMRDGHVTYHVEAAERPAAPPAPAGVDHAELVAPERFRAPWATVEGLRELLGWATGELAAAGRPVTGPVEQHRTWNLACLCRLPTARGPVWLKATPHFAADEAAAFAAIARHDPGLVPAVLAAGDHRVLLEHVPGDHGVDPSRWSRACSPGSPECSPHLPPGRRNCATAVTSPARSARCSTAACPGCPPPSTPGRAGSPGGGASWPPAVCRTRWCTTRPIQNTPDRRPDARRRPVLNWPRSDFHPGNWRGDPPVVLDLADTHLGNPVLDGLRAADFLPEAARPAAARAWVRAWAELVPGSDPARALAVAEPLAHLAYAVRYQEFLDGIEPSERVYHEGDPAAAIRTALRVAREPSPWAAA